jgi:hypothetical protein
MNMVSKKARTGKKQETMKRKSYAKFTKKEKMGHNKNVPDIW